MSVASEEQGARRGFEGQAGKGAGGHQLNSEHLILNFLAEIKQFRSVAQFGCGQTRWLEAARLLGAIETREYDRLNAPAGNRDTASGELIPEELVPPLNLEKKFDLALCLDGLQHTGQVSAENLTRTLCGASHWVLFAAAIPWQSGTRLLSEHWTESWARMFLDNGYVCYDILRKHFWHDSGVAVHYRQGMCLFVRRGAHNALKARGYQPSQCPPSLIHPETYLKLAVEIAGPRGADGKMRALYRTAGKLRRNHPDTAAGEIAGPAPRHSLSVDPP